MVATLKLCISSSQCIIIAVSDDHTPSWSDPARSPDCVRALVHIDLYVHCGQLLGECVQIMYHKSRDVLSCVLQRLIPPTSLSAYSIFFNRLILKMSKSATSRTLILAMVAAWPQVFPLHLSLPDRMNLTDCSRCGKARDRTETVTAIVY